MIAKRGITDERAALQSALDTFQQSALGRNDFVSGLPDPNMGDLAVYGTLRSVEGLQAHRNVMSDPNNVALHEWYLRVQERLTPY
jgi:microsomal prostaglandin-E synthase 2